MLKRSVVLSLAALASFASVAAAQNDACHGVPGAAFGVIEYTCANCGFRNERGAPPVYTFYVEPVVQQAEANSPVRAGDIIEAVDGKPITTRAGADAFANPARSESELTIRRGRDRITVKVTLPPACAWNNASLFFRGQKLPNRIVMDSFAQGFRGFGGDSLLKSRLNWMGDSLNLRHRLMTDSLIWRLRTKRDSLHPLTYGKLWSDTSGGRFFERYSAALIPPRAGKFGFAVACTPSCSSVIGADGTFYYRYDDQPRITAVRSGSAAERGGLRVGDVIAEVDGMPILESRGAQRFFQMEKRSSVQLTVLRDGQKVSVTLTDGAARK